MRPAALADPCRRLNPDFPKIASPGRIVVVGYSEGTSDRQTDLPVSGCSRSLQEIRMRRRGLAKATSCGVNGLRVEIIFLNEINVIWVVQSLQKKYSGFPKKKSALDLQPSCPTRGALANVTDAGQDAVDADGASDDGA